MSIQFSPIITPQTRGNANTFSVKIFNLLKLSDWVSPVAFIFHSRERVRRFEAHPHAGFSAITYVLEDSPAGMRTRDTLGNDIEMGPGGIVWTQAGSGILHEESPIQPDRELHGLQIFVNLSSKNKLTAPEVFHLAKREVPEWRSGNGDRVRVLVGSYQAISSPLAPAEPFNLFDVEIRREISFDLKNDHNALVYVLSGEVLVSADGQARKVSGDQAMALHGSGGSVTLAAIQPAQILILSGAAIHEPVLMDGNFMMNEQWQLDAAAERYRSGEMGQLSPLPGVEYEAHPAKHAEGRL
jgi:redox-sensitive bicupin YhaK (pirin superfamily)